MLAIKQKVPGLCRGLSSNFWLLRSTNHVKIAEECMMCTEKHIFVKKIFTNLLSTVLLLRAPTEKTVHGTETPGLFNSKKFGAECSVKKVMLRVFWDMNGLIIWFPFKKNSCKVFPVANFLKIFYLIYWMTLVITTDRSIENGIFFHIFGGCFRHVTYYVNFSLKLLYGNQNNIALQYAENLNIKFQMTLISSERR